MDACDSANQPKLKPLVILSGTAKEGSAGPPIGLVDIGVSENAYLFRVALPGIRRNESKLLTSNVKLWWLMLSIMLLKPHLVH
jgi:hypothetical protein